MLSGCSLAEQFKCVPKTYRVLAVVVIFYVGGSVKLLLTQQPVLASPAGFKIPYVGLVKRFYLADKRFCL